MTTDALRPLLSQMIMTPAYGKTYPTEEALRSAWAAGADFKIKGGPYTSIRDLKHLREHCSSLWIIDLISKHTICVG